MNRLRLPVAVVALTLLGLSLTACARAPVHDDGGITNSAAVRLGDVVDVETILPELAQQRVVFVGESHDRYEHHLAQLAIIKGIHQRYPRLAIGLEFFQWPFQEVLDRFVAGEIDEAQMLRQSEYFSRWRFDYRLYKPILDYARANRITLVALNVPAELTEKVSAGGLAALTAEERASLPADIERKDPAYRARVEAVYKLHPQRPDSNFENFLDVQLCWDEGMAATAATFLKANPDHKMVILAGTGHVIEGTGIPNRLTRRLDLTRAIVINGDEMGIDITMGDYLLLPAPQSLPELGQLGVYLDPRDDGLYVEQLEAESGAAEAGIRAKDKLLSIDGIPLQSYADLRIALLNKLAGDTVKVALKRVHWWRGEEELVLDVTLQSRWGQR